MKCKAKVSVTCKGIALKTHCRCIFRLQRQEFTRLLLSSLLFTMCSTDAWPFHLGGCCNLLCTGLGNEIREPGCVAASWTQKNEQVETQTHEHEKGSSLTPFWLTLYSNCHFSLNSLSSIQMHLPLPHPSAGTSQPAYSFLIHCHPPCWVSMPLLSSLTTSSISSIATSHSSTASLPCLWLHHSHAIIKALSETAWNPQ